MKFLSLVLYFSLIITSAFSQDSYYDSLKKILPTAPDDTNKVYAYSDIAYSYQWSNPDSALLYALPGLALARKLNFERGEYDILLPVTEALAMKGNYSQALKFRFRSIELAYRLKDSTKIGNSLALTGNVYAYSKEYDKALEYLYRAKKTNAVTLGGPKVLNVMIGKAYFLLQKWDSAFVYIQKAYDLDHADTNDRWTEPPHYLAALYEQKGDLVKALDLYRESLTMGGANNSILQNYNGLASVYRKTGQTDSAILYAKQAISLGTTVSITAPVIEASALLVEIYKSQRNIDSAFKYQDMLTVFKDSLFSQDKIKQLQNVTFDEQLRQQEVSIEKEKYESRIKLYALVAALTVFITIGGYSFYRYRRRRKLQSEQELMNERLRISRELHDEVGATLSGIAMYSHLTKEQIKQSDTIEVEKSLNIMQQSAGEMVNKLNDIVWLVNPDQGSLQKLIQRLEEYARDMGSIKNMQVKINIPENLHEHSLPMESRRNIYLFCKEAINNAVKYSEGSLLELNIKEVANKLEFSVSDNGKGFDAVMVRRGNGLENMQKRADEIHAKLTIQSKQDEGSLVAMQIKIT